MDALQNLKEATSTFIASSTTDKFTNLRSLPLFTHPPYLLALLLCTLLPAVLLLDKYGARDPPPSQPQTREQVAAAIAAVGEVKSKSVARGNVMAVKQGNALQPIGGAGKEKPLEEVKGDVKVDDKPPSAGELAKAGKVEVFDAEGKRHSFADLVTDGDGRGKRVLVVFVRHFFCGQCQEYLRVLSLALPPSHLSSLPAPHPPTSLLVIGCGAPDMIATYSSNSQCPYPIYADPDRKLYSILRMTRTLSLGANPTYMQAGLLKLTWRSLVQELKAGRNMFRGGDYSQVGGEFVFESSSVGEKDGKRGMEGVKVPWCHRMSSTRDHTPIDVTRKQLGLDGGSLPPRRRESKRFSLALGGAREGLGRRLSSSKRMSWHAGAAPAHGSAEMLNGHGDATARSEGGLKRGASVKVSEKEASQERSIMEQLKEEGETTESSQPAQDREAALKKLTGGGPLMDGTTNIAEDKTEKPTSVATDDSVNSTPPETKAEDVTLAKEPPLEEEEVFHEASEEPKTNGLASPNGHADKIEQPHSDSEKTEPPINGTAANGHAVAAA